MSITVRRTSGEKTLTTSPYSQASQSSPSFLQTVLAGSVKAELFDLQVEVKELEKNIQSLTVSVHEDITGRYITFDKFDDSVDVQTYEKCMEDLKEIGLKIADGRVKTDFNDPKTRQELITLQDALDKLKSTLSVTCQLLGIDRIVQALKKSSKERRYLEAAAYYSDIPPMFQEVSESHLYQDLCEGLKRECQIQNKLLLFRLGTQWNKTLLWNNIDQSSCSGTKLVTLKVLKDQEMKAKDILMAMNYMHILESTLNTFGSTLLQLVLVPIMTAVTVVAVKDSPGYLVLSVDISLSSEKPPLTTVAANLKVVFQFVNELIEINVNPRDRCLCILGAGIANDFSKALLKECLIVSSEQGIQDADFYQGLEELYELIEGIRWFLRRDDGDNNLMEELTKLMRRSENNPAFWESTSYLRRGRAIIKKDLNETLLVQENCDSLCHQRQMKDNSDTSEKTVRQSPLAFPSCRVSKWIVELVNLVREISSNVKSEKRYDNQDYSSCKTVRRIVELYIALSPVPCDKAGKSSPSHIALFHNNSMYLAHNLILMGFDVGKQSKHRELVVVDLIQHLRKIAIQSLVKYLMQQQDLIVEKIKETDLAKKIEVNGIERNWRDSCAELKKSVQESLRQMEHLHSALKGVLDKEMCRKGMGGIVNAFLRVLIHIFSSLQSSSGFPREIARDIEGMYKVVADKIPLFFEVGSDLGSSIHRWSSFQPLLQTRLGVE